METRSRRALQGIHCPICGTVGFYRQNCPNKCESPPGKIKTVKDNIILDAFKGTPDSMASTPRDKHDDENTTGQI